MADKIIQEQINEINRKLDLLIEEAAVQRQNRESVNDLIDDLSVIGKEAFKDMVQQLDNAGVELNGDALRCLLIRLIRNIENIGTLLESVESINDLMKDLTPIIKQIGLDGIKKFHEFEQKGYFEVINQVALSADTIITRYPKEELKTLSEKLIPLADSISNLTDRGFLEKLDAITIALKEINTDEIEEISVWRMMREMRKPEVKKSLGFIMAFLSKINEQNIKKAN
jgi:uncharacterized protein YjgD (DUF1641 family)